MTATSVRVPVRTEFDYLFQKLTGLEQPYEWQWTLFREFVTGQFPSVLTLPTGLGKTSVMPIWFLALAWELLDRPNRRSMPTRLVWVVDRRVVVDQATTEAERIAEALDNLLEDDPLRLALERCSIIGKSQGVLAISTLRGERADNRAWSFDPSRPAIIVGTVDMIGSRLLFSGYGDGRRRRALHAGLLGQDTLIVNDEAHLTSAFASLIVRVREFATGQRPLRTLLLSATPRSHNQAIFPPSLDADLKHETFVSRYRAPKQLHLHEHDEVRKKIEELALISDRRTLVFVRSPAEARKLVAAIQRKHKGIQVPLITGMQRGWERDQLLNHPVLKPFLSKERRDLSPSIPCWLVATSAGEVGIDLSSDRLITDLDTADHLLQRFGRLNRFGETEGVAHIVYSRIQVNGSKSEMLQFSETLAYLKTLPDLSPESLHNHPPPPAALSAIPHEPPLLPWHIDVWSMTSINAGDWPSRPAVEFWLRGDAEDSPPETYVAWRKDVADLAAPQNGILLSELEEVFSVYPVLAHERVKQYTQALCDSLNESSYLGQPAILIAADGEIYADMLDHLLQNPYRFRYATLVLPPGIGYLDANGSVDWEKRTDELSKDDLERYDVADYEANRQRVRLKPNDPEPNTGLRLRCSIELRVDDESGPQWMYFSGPIRRQKSHTAQELTEHESLVAQTAAQLAERLGLPPRIVNVFRWAGQWHDHGKNRPVWQRAAGNLHSTLPLAKSDHFNGRLLGGYRHELGSLLDAEAQLPSDFTAEERDLAMHLIGCHHGWARPHFPDVGYDKTAYLRSKSAAAECPRRFGRLLRSYNAWSLAYLESIFRAADAMASEDTPELHTNA